jgi:hypothetical protein
MENVVKIMIEDESFRLYINAVLCNSEKKDEAHGYYKHTIYETNHRGNQP